VKALLLVGTVGSGKTTVLLELGRHLSVDGEPHALVDLDWLAWVDPSPTSELSVHEILVANLAAAVETFRRAGVTRLVLARHLTRAEDLASIEAALGGAELAVVRLDAPAAVLEARIRSRDSGRELEAHLGAIGAAERPEFPHVTVENDGRPPAEVADEILAAIGWWETDRR
jgi:GTPase SAR1 family protein